MKREHVRRPRHSAPNLVMYLDCQDNWFSSGLPSLSDDSRLRRARNSKKDTQDNNDLLEFIGDRVVNLACALMVERVKYSSDHQMWVGRVISNNDTLGRLAYQLRLHEHARLDLHDLFQVQDWNPGCNVSPPKPLADLFEAYVGAVYEEKGWNAAVQWLQTLYRPLIAAATEDFHDSAPSIPAHWHTPSMAPAESRNHAILLDYLNYKGQFLASCAHEALDALPLSSIFVFAPNGSLGNDCDKLNPEMQQATAKAAHLVTCITKAIVNEWSLGYLGSLLTLSSYFEETDPDYNSNRALLPPQYLDSFTRNQEIVYCTKLSFVLKAAIGWYYLTNPKRAEKWGIAWFKFMVIQAHDLIVRDHRYKPAIPSSSKVAPSAPGAEHGRSDRAENSTKSSWATAMSRPTVGASSLTYAFRDLGISGS